jgi:hypothetical protein
MPIRASPRIRDQRPVMATIPLKTAPAIEVVTRVPRSPGDANQIIDQRGHRLDAGVTLEFHDIRPHHCELGYPSIVYRRERLGGLFV